MKTVIIGYGSIGRKHASVLSKSFKKIKLFICTKQKVTNFRCFKNLNKIKEIQPDYVIIASETSKHYQQLKYLENNLKNTKILVEKPLFHINKKLNIKNNKVYVGYNLRFHPFILKLKEILKKKNFFDAQFITNSYLPSWRKNISHRKNYSSNKSQGGGIVLDLSHELDIIGSLINKYKIIYANVQKKTKLTFNTEDSLKLYLQSKEINVSIDLKYFSRNEVRLILIDGKNFSITVDLFKGVFIFFDNKKKYLIKKKYNQYYTILKMHEAIIKNKNKINLCTYSEAKKVLQNIELIKKFR